MTGLPPFEVYFTFLAGTLALVLTTLHGASKWIRNAGIVDVFWAASFGIIVLSLYFSLYPEARSITNWVFTSMVAISSVRLTWHIGCRFVHEFPKEDARYTGLRSNWPSHPEAYMWLIFMFQGALITLLSSPFYVVFAHSGESRLPWLSIAAGVLWLLGMVIEAIADYQLHLFKTDAKHERLAILQSGLWSYSRHPNYFGQWLTWVAFSLYILSCDTSPLGLSSLLQPAIMLFMLTRMSGVPITEAHMLATRGAAYEAYCRNTPAFFPRIKTVKDTSHD